MIRRFERESEIVHCENIFKKFGPLEITNASGLTSSIKLMRHRVSTDIEIMIVGRLVNAHSPQYDRRVIPVATDHAANVVHRNIFPVFISNMLPAGYLFEHQKS